MARASAPISSLRPVCGTSTPSAPSATCLMVAVITESGRAIERAMISTPMHDHRQREHAKAGQHKRQDVVRVGLLRQSLARSA